MTAPESQVSTVRRLLEQGQDREALRCAKQWRKGDPALLKALKTGYECLLHPGTYSQMGVDVEQAIATGIGALKLLVRQ